MGIQSRIERALTQRLYLIQTSTPTTSPIHCGPSITLTVLGSTGNVYEVNLSKVPSCNCPDYAKGNLCKHLLFVMLKVAGLNSNDPLVYQSAYVTEEMEDIVQKLQRRTAHLSGEGGGVGGGDTGGILANEAVRKKHQDSSESQSSKGSNDNVVQRKAIEEGTECPICFDDLGEEYANNASSTKLTYCQRTCGTNFHAECIRIWTSQGEQRQNPTCPACRQPWIDVKTGGCCSSKRSGVGVAGGGDEGYENLGALQGQSRVRDTSTYQSYDDYDYGYYKRRRYW
eukprot:CAMPEP_0204635066 /NCGR_PEP_ID=MMETSP0717-20131115/30687_1 /ASSEMBLY_ACC=CAM_ASM_000666 /TAXON_ID=230516 /ORGANISM="Chaetoceros curvisetus" /LENGTH=283 /DNA_ID=CAMNT_0051653699 /DNA_START=10 /DNA_END=861 /DNA_ORIENTATION=+